MNELLILLTAMMSEMDIVEKVEEAIQEYKLVPTSENYNRVVVTTQLISIKSMVGNDMGKAINLIAKYKRYESNENLTSLEKLIGN